MQKKKYWFKAISMYGGGGSPIMICDYETFKKWRGASKRKNNLVPPLKLAFWGRGGKEISESMSNEAQINDIGTFFYKFRNLDLAMEAMEEFGGIIERKYKSLFKGIIYASSNHTFFSKDEWLKTLKIEGGNYDIFQRNRFLRHRLFNKIIIRTRFGTGTHFENIEVDDAIIDLGFGKIFCFPMWPNPSNDIWIGQSEDEIIFLDHFFPILNKDFSNKNFEHSLESNEVFLENIGLERIQKLLEEKKWQEESVDELNIETALTAALGVISSRQCLPQDNEESLFKLNPTKIDQPHIFRTSKDGWGDNACAVLPKSKGSYKIYKGAQSYKGNDNYYWKWYRMIRNS